MSGNTTSKDHDVDHHNKGKPRHQSRARQRLLAHRESLQQLDSIGAINLEDYSSDSADPEDSSTAASSLQLDTSRPVSACLSVQCEPTPMSARSSHSRAHSESSSSQAAAAADTARCIVNAATVNNPLLSIMNTAAEADHDALLLAAERGDSAAVACVLGIEERQPSAGVAQQLLAPAFHPDDARSADNFTALHHAASGGHAAALRLLLSAGASVSAQNRGAETPLFLACYHGHGEAVRWLLAGGAGVNARNEFGETPLFYAARRGHREIAELLLQNGAHAAAQNRFGETAAEEAEDETLAAMLNAAAHAPARAEGRKFY
eukprot:TRINITY_DN4747_c0_g1_i2.p1 TRINITY_DN4747_c0_g1~~TRINITY_DN4747_c0_g1_i2.p1  ORF type:complete len:320 (+),score=88.79 TRINITY_DN4747_c0_g1_i2:217-1176(+)